MREFLHYLRKNRVSYIVSILVLTLTFLVSALSFLMYDVVDNTSKNMEDKVQIVGYVDSGESKYYKDNLVEDIEGFKNVSGVVYQESEDELEEFLDDLEVGGELFDDVVEDNPLEDTVYIHLTNSEVIEDTYRDLLESEYFDEDTLIYNSDGVEIIENLTVMFYVVIITLIVVVTTITVPIINILIKNSIDSRSSEIRVKRLIGAKKISIVSPILLELLVMLLVSMAMFTVISYYLLQLVRETVNSFGIDMVEIGGLQEIFVNSFAVNILFGLVIMMMVFWYVVVTKVKV